MNREKELKAVEEIHQASLKILNEIGIKFGLDEVNEIFKKNGFRQEDGRTFFTEEQVMHALDIATKEFTMYGRDEQYSINVNTTDVNYTPGYGSPMITNRDGSVRNATFDDFLTMANLFHMEKSYDINGGILVQPYDIEAEISIPAMVYATIKRSSKVLFGIQGDEKDQENIFKILEIAFGGKEKLKEKNLSQSSIFLVTVILGIINAAVGCSQTIAIILTLDIVKDLYKDQPNDELALDISNSAILTPALIPWCIAALVPSSLLKINIYSYIPFAFYLYIVPIIHFIRKKFNLFKSENKDLNKESI
jgi:hypothetical protein